MKKILILALLPLLVLLASGCMEQTMLITVRPDGSGTMRLRMFMSDQIAGGMAMAGAMGQEMAGDLAGVPEAGEQAPAMPTPADMVEGIKTTLEAHKDEMGEGVEFVEGKEVTNKKGWKGYEAFYRFKDINKITAGAVEQESSGEGPGGPGDPAMDFGNMADFKFRFTPGTPARLEIIAEDQAEAEEASTVDEPEDAMAEQMAEQMAAAMMGMMKPMLAGMRMTAIIKVDGEVVNSNAKYRGKKNQNAILLYDLDFDKILAHPDGMKLLTSDDPNAANDLDIPGLRTQDLEETVFMEFK